jgi:hypothetical protein
MPFQAIDQFARDLKPETRASVYQSTKTTHEKRTKLLFDQYADPNRLRELAGEIKQHAIENLDTFLPQVEAKLTANGAKVHWASTAQSACETVLRIMQARGATKLVKAKTMVSEEIELAHFLEKHGVEISVSSSSRSTTIIRATSSDRSSTRTAAKSRRVSSARGWARTTTTRARSRAARGTFCGTSICRPTSG